MEVWIKLFTKSFDNELFTGTKSLLYSQLVFNIHLMHLKNKSDTQVWIPYPTHNLCFGMKFFELRSGNKRLTSKSRLKWFLKLIQNRRLKRRNLSRVKDKVKMYVTYSKYFWKESLKYLVTCSGWTGLFSQKTKAADPARGRLLTAACEGGCFWDKCCVCVNKCASVCVYMHACYCFDPTSASPDSPRFCHMLLSITPPPPTRTHMHSGASAADCKQGDKRTEMRIS